MQKWLPNLHKVLITFSTPYISNIAHFWQPVRDLPTSDVKNLWRGGKSKVVSYEVSFATRPLRYLTLRQPARYLTITTAAGKHSHARTVPYLYFLSFNDDSC